MKKMLRRFNRQKNIFLLEHPIQYVMGCAVVGGLVGYLATKVIR